MDGILKRTRLAMKRNKDRIKSDKKQIQLKKVQKNGINKQINNQIKNHREIDATKWNQKDSRCFTTSK